MEMTGRDGITHHRCLGCQSRHAVRCRIVPRAAETEFRSLAQVFRHLIRSPCPQPVPGVGSRREHLLPVVSYAVERRLASGRADFWDHATRLQLAVLAVLAEDEPGARRALGRSLAMVRWSWEPESTAADLRLIREARQRRGDDVPWTESVERELLQRAGSDTAGQHLNHSRG